MHPEIRIGLSILLILQVTLPAWADGGDVFQFLEEEAKAVTASRQEQSIRDIPQAVDVITPEEIHASGAVNIWDLLRFRAGMDVLDGRSTDGNRAVVSMRGFPHEYASTALVMIDGRSINDTSQAGVRWEDAPVQLQDIERIEIIRGPNTALYGTGAGSGVINIITKKPEEKPSAEIDNRGGSLGMVQSYQAVNASVGKAAVRVSHTFQQQNGFPVTAGARARFPISFTKTWPT